VSDDTWNKYLYNLLKIENLIIRFNFIEDMYSDSDELYYFYENEIFFLFMQETIWMSDILYHKLKMEFESKVDDKIDSLYLQTYKICDNFFSMYFGDIEFKTIANDFRFGVERLFA